LKIIWILASLCSFYGLVHMSVSDDTVKSESSDLTVNLSNLKKNL